MGGEEGVRGILDEQSEYQVDLSHQRDGVSHINNTALHPILLSSQLYDLQLLDMLPKTFLF